jgi:RNA polymerase sigma-70 factor (ECF subfamily)
MRPEATQTDAELVARAAAGSSAAFEALYDRHVAGVARALASFAGPDRELLDDLVQEVFLRVVRHLASYVPTHPFTHWLYTITLNVGRNHVRDRAKVRLVGDEVLDEMAAPEPEDRVGAATLMRMVTLLPVAMQEVVSLRVSAELSYQEIAALLGIPEGTARSRMHHALRLLRERAQPSCRKCNGDG